MAALSDLIPYITNGLPMVSDLIALQQLNRSARTMCSESYCWKYEYTFNTVDGQQDYAYVLPADTERVIIDYVRYSDEYLKPFSWDRIAQEYEDPDKVCSPNVFAEKLPGEISLYPTPNAVEEVKIRLAIMPQLGKDIMDDALQAQHGQTIANGALSYLMLIPGKVWSDPQGGILYNELFTQGINRARTKSRDGSTRRVREVRYGGL